MAQSLARWVPVVSVSEYGGFVCAIQSGIAQSGSERCTDKGGMCVSQSGVVSGGSTVDGSRSITVRMN